MKHLLRRGAAAHAPLFARIRHCMRLASFANLRGMPPVDELVGMVAERRQISRRAFLKSSMAGLGVAGFMGAGLTSAAFHIQPPSPSESLPRIAILGGGMAGMRAAYSLGKANLPCTVYEASDRFGGRIYSVENVIGPGLVTEMGGEVIDGYHKDMLALVREFDLELLDMQAGDEADFADAYFFGGEHYSEQEVVEALRPLAAAIQADYDSLGDVVDFENEGGATELDNLSVDAYLDRIRASGWIRALIEGAAVAEYGLDTHEQSALNLLLLIGTEVEADEYAVYDESDERYRISGGNHRVIDELQKRVRAEMMTGYRLEAIRPHSSGFRLTFQRGGSVQDVDADFVICTIPFTILREIDVQVELPAFKRKVIAELDYGTNAKLIVGSKRRVWREQGYSGEIVSDADFQMAWDNSRLEAGEVGGITFFSGGQAGITVGQGTPQAQAMRLLPGLEQAFPGVIAAHNGVFERFHWPTHPFTKGSYACYKPGQWTTIAGAEIVPVGNLYFAGEHCSYEFQGYMNGAAETGRRVANSLLRSLGWHSVLRFLAGR